MNILYTNLSLIRNLFKGVDFKSKLIPVKSASTGLTENVKAIVWDTGTSLF